MDCYIHAEKMDYVLRKQVGIARALVHDPKLVLFDEPLTATTMEDKEHCFNDYELVFLSTLVMNAVRGRTAVVTLRNEHLSYLKAAEKDAQIPFQVLQL